MRSLAMFTVMVLAAAFLMAGPAVKDQTVATWTINDEEDGERLEYSMTVHSGVLEVRELEFCASCPPKGGATSTSVKLENVKSFTRDSVEGEEGVVPVQRIGITARGEHDITVTHADGKSHTQGGTPGFAAFPIDQKKLRDEVYAKLCAMIGQKP